jgi:hypothetical protein
MEVSHVTQARIHRGLYTKAWAAEFGTAQEEGWPRPGSDEPFEKNTFYIKVGDLRCRLLQEITCRALMSAYGT